MRGERFGFVERLPVWKPAIRQARRPALRGVDLAVALEEVGGKGFEGGGVFAEGF